MFSKRKRNAAPPPPAIQTPPARIPPSPLPAAPFATQAHGKNSSTAAAIPVSRGNAPEAPLVSPLQMTFDFELPHRSPLADIHKPSLDSLRPRTSDGLGANTRKSTFSLAPPSLPPIPRIASRNETGSRTPPYESGGSDTEAMPQPRKMRDDSDNASISSKKSVKSTASRKSFKIFEMTKDELNKAPSLPSRPVSPGSIRPSTSNGMPKMEGTLFPKVDTPVLPSSWTPPSPAQAVDRSFIDSRDRPFQPAPAKVPATRLQASSSTPDLSSTLKGASRNFSQKSPLSPQTPASASPLGGPRPTMASATSTPNVLRKRSSRPDLQGKRAQSNLGGTAAPSKQSAKPEQPTPTVGTPYGQTSPSFPLPQHVVTRPKTAGAASTIAGISVPTHHTSQSSSRPETAKAEKRKTKFLNPMAMFTRRRSAQNEAEVQKEVVAQEVALARQKNVAVAGVRNVPDDFDPRIRGKVVHDFSAPNRQSMRSFTFNDAAEGLRGHQSRLQTTNSAPSVPALQQDGMNVRQSTFSANSSTSGGTKKSLHAPVFVEHLADTPLGATRVNAERAESLANRDFLQRASYVSRVSQESAILPPFARRSQVMDPMQAALFTDDSSNRSSDPSSTSAGTEKHRDSGASSLSSVSPITARHSNMPPEMARQSTSPISPTSPSRTGFGAGSRPKSMASSHLRESTVFVSEEEGYSQQPLPQCRSPPSGPNAEPTMTPPDRCPPPPPPLSPVVLSPVGPTSTSALPAFSRISTTGEEQLASAVRLSKPFTSPPKVVEKRASAVGHSKRGSGMPKHHVSNASRFSFQLGGSAAEELALEEKARKMRSGVSGYTSTRGGRAGSASEEDEDEYFDEDAMDDMDEMELREEPDEPQALLSAQSKHSAGRPNTNLPPHITVPPRQHHITASQPSPGVMSVNDTRLQLVVTESDGEDNEGASEESASEGGYYDLVDYDSLHSRGASVTTDQSFKPSFAVGSNPTSPFEARHPQMSDAHVQHSRALDDDSGLALDSDTSFEGQSKAIFGQHASSPNGSAPGSVAGAHSRNGYHVQPTSAGDSPTNARNFPLAVLRHSGNAEQRSPPGSGKEDLVASPLQPFANKHKSATSNSTVSSSDENRRPFSDATMGAESSSRSSGPRTGSTGLGVSGFGDFHFSDSPDNSRPVSRVLQKQNRLTGDSETIPQHAGWLAQHRKRGSSPFMPSSERNSKGSPIVEHRYTGSVGKNLQARKSSLADVFSADARADTDDEDDMYFDGGGFEGDLQTGKHDLGASMNEEVFDDDRFKRGQPMIDGLTPLPVTSHHRDTSATTVVSLGSDGPYPSFAMPNPAKARQRDSHMMLEDVVLQAPVDPKYIPQRNPSEDAKRLGLSSKVPPLPAQPGNIDAADRVQSTLQAYHAALAEAANRAASDGRFLRMPSVSTLATQRSTSVYSKAPDADKSAEDLSHRPESLPSRSNTDAQPVADGNLDESDMQQTTSTVGSALNHSTSYSPPKMTFDFGFDSTPLIDQDFDLDDFGSAEDDIVAAANAEALASDEDGFYGQEFGFFAKARPNSGDVVQACNGGYFGDDGDDGLTRNKSLKEPNLTPITERSEFSTRNSFIGGSMFGPASATFGPASAGLASPALARLPILPLMEVDGDITSFDQLKKLRLNAFSGSNASLGSSAGSHRSAGAAAGPGAGQGYFGAGGSPMLHGHSNDSAGSAHSAPGSAHPASLSRFTNGGLYESPASAGAASERQPFSSSLVEEASSMATPRKAPMEAGEVRPESPLTARKAKATHSRQSSGADSVTYVRESDPASPNGQPRWVLERRRTSEQGLSELVGREVVQGGWI